MADVLLHVQPGSLSPGVDRATGRTDRSGRGCLDAGRSVERPARGRRNRRRGKRHRVPAEYHDPIPVHRFHGGFGLPGSRSLHHGPDHAPHRTARQVVHSAHHGFRLQRTGHHGHAHDRKPQQPAHHRTARPLHVVQRPHSYLYPADRHVLRRLRQLGDARTVSAGNRRGRHHGPTDAPLSVQEGRNAVRHGAAALSGPDNAGYAVAHVGSLRAILAQDGRADSNRFGGGLVLELLSDAGRSRPGRNYGGTL